MGIKTLDSWVSKPFGSWVSKTFWFMGIKNLLVHGSQKPYGSRVSKTFWFMGIKTLWFKGRKNLMVQGSQKPLVQGSQKPYGSRVSKPFSQKKEDIKKDEQIKIKILKSFDDGLQYKNKKVWDYKGTTSSLT
jgi:outer membrane PBP1 activator LpoA protein